MKLVVIGGGLAGCEAAWQASIRGINVDLYEMRPGKTTSAHQTDFLGELICSNSLGSNLPNRASGLLKAELRKMGSLLISCADASSLPAGGALAVDRTLFSQCIHRKIENQPNINVIREEVTSLPKIPTVIATGPLTSSIFASSLARLTGEDYLYFYDAIAPIIEYESIDLEIAFRANRYDQGQLEEGDYINCPFDEKSYLKFRKALISAERILLKANEEAIINGVVSGGGEFFQGCQPVEIIAEKGEKALAFGPMRPVGLTDPRTGRWPFAAVQLRQDNIAGNLYNLVGFQTNLTFKEQKRVFRLIPGLKNAVFSRYGQMHRNLFIASPKLLNESLSFSSQPNIFFAGQITGIEGYAGNIASGLVAGINAARYLNQQAQIVLPRTTMIGALLNYITHADMKDFQPMKAIFGLLPSPDDGIRRSKRDRFDYYNQRALNDLEEYLHNMEIIN